MKNAMPNLAMIRNFVISDSFSAGTYLVDLYHYNNLIDQIIAKDVIPKMQLVDSEYNALSINTYRGLLKLILIVF